MGVMRLMRAAESEREDKLELELARKLSSLFFCAATRRSLYRSRTVSDTVALWLWHTVRLGHGPTQRGHGPQVTHP